MNMERLHTPSLEPSRPPTASSCGSNFPSQTLPISCTHRWTDTHTQTHTMLHKNTDTPRGTHRHTDIKWTPTQVTHMDTDTGTHSYTWIHTGNQDTHTPRTWAFPHPRAGSCPHPRVWRLQGSEPGTKSTPGSKLMCIPDHPDPHSIVHAHTYTQPPQHSSTMSILREKQQMLAYSAMQPRGTQLLCST